MSPSESLNSLCNWMTLEVIEHEIAESLADLSLCVTLG